MNDEMFDMMDMAREINEAMGRSYDVPDNIDESDLMAELDGLEAEMGAEELGEGGTPSYLQVGLYLSQCFLQQKRWPYSPKAAAEVS